MGQAPGRLFAGTYSQPGIIEAQPNFNRSQDLFAADVFSGWEK